LVRLVNSGVIIPIVSQLQESLVEILWYDQSRVISLDEIKEELGLQGLGSREYRVWRSVDVDVGVHQSEVYIFHW
jgi:hypothetical protein